MSTMFFDGWIEAIIWFIIAGGFVVAEAFTPSFFLIWFAGGALVSCILALIGLNEVIQVFGFMISSVVLLALARPIVRTFIFKNKKPVASNVDSLVGVKAIVTSPINQISGKVKIMNTGEIWSAYTYEHYDPIEENTQVIIKEVDGAKLIVIPKLAHDQQKI